MGNLWFFENVNLFSIFCPHKFKEYKENHQFRNFKKGEFIYFSDDPSNSIYLVTEGKIKLLYYTEEGDEVVKSVLTRGEVFGELALLGVDTRQDYAQVVADRTAVCQLTLEQMQQLMKDDVSFALKISKLERRIDSLVFKEWNFDGLVNFKTMEGSIMSSTKKLFSLGVAIVISAACSMGQNVGEDAPEFSYQSLTGGYS